MTTSCGDRNIWVTNFCEDKGVLDPPALRQVVDGASHTLLIGEQTSESDSESSARRRTFWAYTYTSYNKSEASPYTATLLSDYDRCRKITNGNHCKRAWGTAHVSGIQFVYIDGSVHSVSIDIDLEVFKALSTIAGEELDTTF